MYRSDVCMKRYQFLKNYTLGEKILRCLKFYMLFYAGLDVIVVLLCFILMFLLYYIFDFNEIENVRPLMTYLRPILLCGLCSWISFNDGQKDMFNNMYSIVDRLILTFVFFFIKLYSIVGNPINIDNGFFREFSSSITVFYYILVIPCLLIPYYLGYKLAAYENPQYADMYLRDENEEVIKEIKKNSTENKKTGTWRDSVDHKE